MVWKYFYYLRYKTLYGTIPLYIIFHEIYGYIQDILKKYEEMWDKIKHLTKAKNNTFFYEHIKS